MAKGRLPAVEVIQVDPPPRSDARWAKPAYVVDRYGIPRYRIFEMIKEGLFRTALLKRKGRKKGMRLIDLNSLDSYLEDVSKQ